MSIRAVVVFGTGLAATGVSEATETYPVVDSRLRSNPNYGIDWIDNEHVIFEGKIDPSDNSYSVVIWRVGGTASVHKKDVGWFCAGGGNIAYTIHDVRGKAFFGPLNQERPVERTEMLPTGCQKRPQGSKHDRLLTPLLPGHGYIDRGVAGVDDAEKAKLVTGRGREIPLPMRNAEIASVRFYRFKGAYLVVTDYYDSESRTSVTPWPAELVRSLFWLTPNGATSKFEVKAPWNQSVDLFAAKIGYVKVGTDARIAHPKRPGDLGLFLIRPSRVVSTLLSGDVRGVAVSPDGCSIAVHHLDQYLRRDSSHVKVAKLCKLGD